MTIIEDIKANPLKYTVFGLGIIALIEFGYILYQRRKMQTETQTMRLVYGSALTKSREESRLEKINNQLTKLEEKINTLAQQQNQQQPARNTVSMKSLSSKSTPAKSVNKILPDRPGYFDMR